MKAIYIVLVALICNFTVIVADTNSKSKKTESWSNATELYNIKYKAEPINISLDTKGANFLMLVAKSGPGSKAQDFALWANPRVYLKNGAYICLDSLECDYYEARWGTPHNNSNYHGGGISINNKKYDHGVLYWASGMVLYRLPDNTVKFEAEIGVDDSSGSGSINFKAYAGYNIIMNDIMMFKQAMLFHKNVNDYIFDSQKTINEKCIPAVISQLDEKEYFNNKLKNVDDYYKLLKDLFEVYDIQEKLRWLNFDAVVQAFQNMSTISGYNKNDNSLLVEELKNLVEKGFKGIYNGDKLAVADAKRALELKRNILLSNPLIENEKLIAVKYDLGVGARKIRAPQMGTQPNNWSNQTSASRGRFNANIVEISNFKKDVQVKHIYKPDNFSSIADLRMHWDADRVMFTQLQDDKRWNIFEIDIDGKNLRKIIDNEEPDLEFFDGTYLPDGRILAISNIGYQGVPCVSGKDAVGNIVLYNPDNKNLRRLTFDQDANWNPVVMNNGRVMYTRWEYTDLTHYYSRIVMHMNPDGTENKALYGSGAMFPNSIFDVQPIPGKGSAFVGIISGHHGTPRAGRLILFDPAKGRKSTYGMLQEIPFKNRPIKEEIKDKLVDEAWPKFVKPMPLNDKYFLVAAKLSPNSLWGIYLVDVFDNVTCIIEGEDEGYISPILVKKTTIPPVIPDRVKLDQKEATFFIQDIYEGEGLRGIPRGTVKELRLHAYEYAYVKTRSDHNWHGIQSGWDIKRLLGTVPVEEDGSVIFKAPANTPISIQPLDKDGVAIQWMRSWVTGQPGEVVSCIGCHEDQNQIAIPKRVIASQKEPSKLISPEGGVRSFTFDLEIQPILDRACIACHNGEKTFDLRGGRKDEKGYGTSYLNFHPYIHRQGGEGDMVVLQPYEYHPNTSELVRMLKRGHYNVKLTDKEWRTLYNWIDYNAPDKGYFLANKVTTIPYKGFDQIERRKELADKYGNGTGVDWKKELADYASYLKGKGEIVPEMPEPMKEVKVKELKAKGWPFDAVKASEKQSAEGESRKIIEIAPGIKMTFVRIPAGEFVMGSYNGPSDTYPTSKVKIKKAFWMAELETTNEQYNVIFPEHDSRYVDQQWKDHVVQGYPANKPEQPVIRVSYNDAMEYCRKLSEKTGFNITLPTEAQWEWACRAGSDSDFWFGDLHSDFGNKENLADKTTLKFAVFGTDPKPMSPNNGWYKYYTFLPKEESVDDGNLVQVGGKVYEANPFGLYNMHGNVSEWTRSDYLPYPYKENNKQVGEYKVARGGSYIERPKFSTSYSRKGFLPYQRVFNVGFRVIIED